MLVYIAGPLSAETEEGQWDNVQAACWVGRDIMQRGHWPVIPHLNMTYALWHENKLGEKPDYETFMAWDAEILRRCDGLLYLAPSPGADRELAMAEALKLPVYRAVEELPTVREPVGV